MNKIDNIQEADKRKKRMQNAKKRHQRKRMKSNRHNWLIGIVAVVVIIGVFLTAWIFLKPEKVVDEQTLVKQLAPLNMDDVDKQVLKDVVKEAQKCKASFYTKESFEEMEGRLKTAKQVLDDNKATDDQIFTAYINLRGSILALEKKK